MFRMEEKLMRVLRILCCTLAVGVLSLTSAAAQDNTAEGLKLTYLTFSGPVQVPGATLPAGTYTFKLADVNTAHVVQVLSRDRQHMITQFLTIPNDRIDTPEKTIVMFGERPAGAPAAVKIWYYPGNRSGEEFIYPKHQAVEIAKAYHTTVLSSDSEDNAKNGKVARIDESGAEAQPESVVAEAQPAPNPSAVGTSGAQNGSAAATNSAPAPSRARRALPRTASNFSATGLLSLLALGSAFGVARVRQRLTDHA